MPPPILSSLAELTHGWAGGIEFVEESDEELVTALRSDDDERIRFAAPNRVPTALRHAAAQRGIFLADAPVVAEGSD
jgi:RHH-type proline utilization regulon transcriptional repressor/proline dehydrogenase/delta 1-pyrroline-5-carboxylate dehydrogenase